MGAIFSGPPSAPKAPPLPPPEPLPPKQYNATAQNSSDNARKLAAAGGRPDTILTGVGGLDATAAPVAKKTLLGQ